MLDIYQWWTWRRTGSFDSVNAKKIECRARRDVFIDGSCIVDKQKIDNIIVMQFDNVEIAFANKLME